jgi:hypothetical protein
MRIFSKELIEKIKSLPEEKRKKVLDGLVSLYATRLHRASEDLQVNGTPTAEAEI